MPPTRDVVYALLRDNAPLVRKILEASPFIDPRGHLEGRGIRQGEFFSTYPEFDHAATALGQVQNRFRAWTEAVVNGFDYGLNGNIGAHPGRFAAAELDCANLLFWLDGLEEAGRAMPGVRGAVARMAGGATVRQTAEAAAEFYALLPGAASGARTEAQSVAPPPPLEIGSLGAADPRAAPADEFLAHVKGEAGWAFDFLVLHGSYATGDYAPGCSDLDTFGILREGVAASAEELLRLRGAVLPAWRHLYRIDPLQHHGVMLASAQDADFYAQHFFPLELFRHAKTVAGARASFGVRDGRFDELVIMHQTLHGLLCSEQGELEALSVHRLKWRLQLVLLLPALSFMTERRYMYKRDSFQEIEKILGRDELRSLRACSRARSENAYGRSEFAWDPHGRIGEQLSAYKKAVLDGPPPPALASALGGGFAPGLRELATRLAARMIAGFFAEKYPHVQAAFEWDDGPSPAEPREYDEAAASIAAKVSSRYRNVSVLRHGSAGSPGISDLDLVVIVEGRTDAGSLAEDWEGMLDARQKYLCSHPPFMVPAGLLGDIQELWPVSRLAKPDGSPVAGVPSEPDWKAHMLTLPELYVFVNPLAGYCEAFASGKIGERAALSAIKSLTYTLAVLRANGVELDPGFEAEADGLRASWFGTDGAARRARLLDLYVRSLGIHLGAIEAARRRIAGEAGGGAGSAFDQIAFVPGWSPRAALDCISEQMYKDRFHLQALPAEFMAQLRAYAGRPGPLARYLSGHIEHGPDQEAGPAGPFERRASLLDRAIGDLQGMGVKAPVLPTFAVREAPAYGGLRRHLLSAMSDPGGAARAACRAERACAELRAGDEELRRSRDALSETLEGIYASRTWRALRRLDSAAGRLRRARGSD